MAGYLWGNRYWLGDRIGCGGMSVVHHGRDVRLGRDVAIRTLRDDLAGDPVFQVRFRRQAGNVASLNHPGIVAVYDAGERPGASGPVPYIVMEYVDGDTLRDVLKRQWQVPPRRAARIVADICAALDFSHRHGMVHGDITPASVMLTRAGAVKVMDFGITRAVWEGPAAMTGAAPAIGTARYLSPEQVRGEAVDARSDVYATGCVLYELLSGAPPFTGDSPVAIARRHVREAPRPPSETKPGLGNELDTIVLKALNKNPVNRYQSAADLRADLMRAPFVTGLTSNDGRIESTRPAPARIGAGGSPPLLAPPVRAMPDRHGEPKEQDRPHRRWVQVGAGVLGLALATAIWLTLAVLTAPLPAALVAVPDLSGMSLPQATAVLQTSRLTLGTLTPTESSQSNIDKVVNQRPSSHTQVAQDTPVNLQIGIVSGQ